MLVWNIDTQEQVARHEAKTFYTFDSEKRARAIGGIRALCFLPDKQLVLGGIEALPALARRQVRGRRGE